MTRIYVEYNELTASDGMPGLESPRLLASIISGRGCIARIYVHYPEPREIAVPLLCTIGGAEKLVHDFFKTHKL